ncbi:hypothetical protein PtA15_6A672 [Puccinia triticina]|uniref:Uncharacterized protein n=1 Tax=Puccinia triticina TaxID=208348 RepID=A0ABY7CPX7_9BASI|nr:uncharacterized protein PtA15_6A672 [Puccinia triticina]WAQ86042.1 hypothetical protein PtA15_6A672 [Puccinia triticina]
MPLLSLLPLPPSQHPASTTPTPNTFHPYPPIDLQHPQHSRRPHALPAGKENLCQPRLLHPFKPLIVQLFLHQHPYLPSPVHPGWSIAKKSAAEKKQQQHSLLLSACITLSPSSLIIRPALL